MQQEPDSYAESQSNAMSDGWRALIHKEGRRLATAYLPRVPKARTLVGMKRGLSRPAIIRCDNRQQYVVKGISVDDRSLTNDQVVARLATMLQAPTGAPEMVYLSDEFVKANPLIEHFQPGLAHATLYIPDLIDTNNIVFEREPENRERYARLAVLYGWLRAADHQFCFEAAAPNLIWSVDHHRFLGGEQWTEETLQSLDDCYPDQWIQRSLALSHAEVMRIASRLPSVDMQTIAQAVAYPPDEWAITMNERMALAECILQRRDRFTTFMAGASDMEGG